MKKITSVVCLAVLFSSVFAQAQTPAHWPQWRGPFFNGMARGDAPTTWSDTTNIKWKTEIPGRGHSTPAIWGDRIFLTTAIAVASHLPQLNQRKRHRAIMPRRRKEGSAADNEGQAALVHWSTIASKSSLSIARRAKSSGSEQQNRDATRRLPSRVRQLRFQLTSH